MKRIVLFLATNMAIVLVLSVSMRLLGVEPYLNANGLNLTSLLIFAAVMGFGGSFISLAISKWSAKKAMGVRVIETPANSTELWLMEAVQTCSASCGVTLNQGILAGDEQAGVLSSVEPTGAGMARMVVGISLLLAIAQSRSKTGIDRMAPMGRRRMLLAFWAAAPIWVVSAIREIGAKLRMGTLGMA